MNKEELKNKELMKKRGIITIISIISYFVIIITSINMLEEGFLLGSIIIVSTIFLTVALFYAFKIEINAGYYVCKNCNNRFIPTYFKAMIRPVLITTRYLKCPKCNKNTWAKKVMTKE